jgi:hypothetical protein
MGMSKFYWLEYADYKAMLERSANIFDELKDMPWAKSDSQDSARDKCVDWLLENEPEHGEGCVILDEQGKVVERVSYEFGEIIDPDLWLTSRDAMWEMLELLLPPKTYEPEDFGAIETFITKLHLRSQHLFDWFLMEKGK